MRISNDFSRYEAERQIYAVLVMHFQEGITQAEIAKLTNLSHAKVNRLIKQGRELGMVEISIRSRYQALFDLESRFREATGLETVRITPSASANPRTILQQVGAAAADLLLELVEDGDTVCITGGKGVSAVVAAPTCWSMVLGLAEALGVIRTISRPVASLKRLSRSNRAW